jgi:hypothetical protein
MRTASTLRIKAAKFLRSSFLRPGFLQKYVCPLAIGVCLALFLHPFHHCKHLLNSKTFETNTQGFCFIPLESVPCWEPMKTKVGSFTHYDSRHYFTTDAIQRGVDIPTIAKWLGHKDGGTLLMKTYSHLLQDHSRAMAKKL